VSNELVRATPILAVREMGEAFAFWQAAGCTTLTYDDQYAFVHREGDEVVHLALVRDLDVATNTGACYLFVLAADRWHEEWMAAGLPVGPLETKPWGMVEFRVHDPSGNVVRVGHSIPAS
jgi:uncharacterized glyoxalase superfamily protein PhnB